MSNSIEFKVLAPYNKAATLIGSFSDWQEIPMQKDKEGYFRTSVELEDGVYQYKFRIQSTNENQLDQWVYINDPYVTEIDAGTNNGIIRIKQGERLVDTYVWQHDDTPLPQNHELVIYEVLIPDFCSGEDAANKQGQFQNAIEKLDYLRDLGINAIELMPVNKTSGGYSWGYNPSHYFAPEPSYGSTADLKRLIDECHARGIRVILDQLYNHSTEDSPLFQIDCNYWYYPDRHHPDDSFYWGPEFDYDHYDDNRDAIPARDFMGDVVRYWIQEYHIDGIRYDALKQLDNPDFLNWITQEATKTAGPKPFYNIGEHIPENPDIIKPNGPMDGCWHDNFYHQIQPHICGETFDLEKLKEALDARHQGYPEGVAKAVNYLSNHDQSRTLADLGDRGILDEAAFKRVKLGVALLMTAVGVPLIWMGEEFGEYAHKQSVSPECRRVDWTLLDNDLNSGLWKYYQGLIGLRQQNPALQTDNIEFFHENPEEKVFAFVRWNSEGSRVVVVASFCDRFLQGYQIPDFPANGKWHEWTRDYDVESSDGQLTIDIGEYEAHVFVGQ